MKIYCKTSRFADPQGELYYYIRKICNKDLWLAVKQEDTYYKWIRAYSNGSEITFSSIYNSAWYPEKYLYGEVDAFGDKMPTDLTATAIALDYCEVVHPVQMYSTEELAPYICSEDNRYRFSEYAQYDSQEDDE